MPATSVPATSPTNANPSASARRPNLARRRAQLNRIADALFAVAFALTWLIGLATSGAHSAADKPHLAALELLALAMTLPFAWRRRAPVVVAVVVYTAGMVEALAINGELPIGFVLTALLGAYSVGAHTRLRVSVATILYAFVCTYIVSFVTSTEGLASEVLTPPLFIALPWAAGRLVARLGDQRQRLARLNVRLENERDSAARTSVLEERARIARELHDIVAHSISVMVVQAGAAEEMIHSGGSAIEPLTAIRTTGQQALIEMRRLLGVLRTDDADTSVLAPQPGLANLDVLVERARIDGLVVTLAVEGEPVPLPTGIDIAAFRLVQEALSNVRKHAQATGVDVTLRFDPRCLRVEVVDDGVGAASADAVGGPGHGLIGMRERVTLYGGTLSTGAQESRGWKVSALLPLPA